MCQVRLLMRLRWITILAALALQLALIVAMLLAGRMVLNNDYAALERDHVEADLTHVCVVLQSQLNDLDLMARDYAADSETLGFLRHPNPRYIDSELSGDVLRARSTRLYMLVDNHNHVRLAQSYIGARATLPADIAQVLLVVKRRPSSNTAVAGLMTLTDGPTMVVMRPIFLRAGDEKSSAGTVIFARNLGPTVLASFSSLSDTEIALSGTIGQSADAATGRQIRHNSVTLTPLGADRLLASTMLDDLWGEPRIRLQIEHDRNIWHQGQQTIHALLAVLVVVGLLFAIVNFWLMQRLVVRRVERLIHFTRDLENDTDLNARVRICGSDELGQLGCQLNLMLDRLKNSQDKLLAVQERLRFEATHDSLTGIWNRAAALQLLDQEIARGSRDGSPVAAIMLDADYFKRINDHFGHSTGDRALQAVAAAITRNLRSFDICCRYGGEEFLVIAPNCNLQQAAEIAQRVLASVRATPVCIPDHAFCVTLSAGVSSSTAPCEAEDLIMAADRALYSAKEKGRDRVELEILSQNAVIRQRLFAADTQPSKRFA